jgi:hypothetical protein
VPPPGHQCHAIGTKAVAIMELLTGFNTDPIARACVLLSNIAGENSGGLSAPSG